MGEEKQVTIPLGIDTVIYLGTMLGIIIASIGGIAKSFSAVGVGILIVSLTLFSGGFLLKNEDGLARLGMFIAGAIVLSVLLTGLITIAMMSEMMKTMMEEAMKAGVSEMPGFEAVFVIVVILAVAYLLKRRK